MGSPLKSYRKRLRDEQRGVKEDAFLASPEEAREIAREAYDEYRANEAAKKAAAAPPARISDIPSSTDGRSGGQTL